MTTNAPRWWSPIHKTVSLAPLGYEGEATIIINPWESWLIELQDAIDLGILVTTGDDDEKSVDERLAELRETYNKARIKAYGRFVQSVTVNGHSATLDELIHYDDRVTAFLRMTMYRLRSESITQADATFPPEREETAPVRAESERVETTLTESFEERASVPDPSDPTQADRLADEYQFTRYDDDK